MSRVYAVALLLVFATAALFAQSTGGGMTAANGGTIMMNTAKGMFVLRAGVLAKYDFATLKKGPVLELYGTVPAPPADVTDRTAMQKYRADIQKRNAAAIMILKENSLLLIVGDGFARINMDTLAVEASKDLTTPVTATDTTTTTAGGGGGFRMSEPVPGYVLVGNTLCLMKSKEILSLNVTDGKIISRSPLPAELQPIQMPFGGGGRNGGGGRTGGGGTTGGGTTGGGGANPGGGGAPQGYPTPTPPAVE